MTVTAGLPFGGKFNQPLPWNPLPYMEEMLAELKIEEKRPEYIRVVKSGLAHFATWCASQGIGHPEELERSHIVKYQAYLNGLPMSVAYRQQLLKYVRLWMNWMEQVGYVDRNPWFRIKIGRTPKKPKPLEDEEVNMLFEAHRQQAFAISPFAFHRREVILTLLYAWGLRIHELHALNVSQLDIRLDSVTSINKGGGTKNLPYGPAVKQVVQRWLVARGRHSKKIGEDPLLIDSNGHRLSIRMIRKIVTDLGDRAGVPINPHRMRDTFGTTMLDNDVEVERIMKMMGHTNVKQTLAYSRVNDKKVNEAHERAMGPILERLLNEPTK